jgi:hypothetical protein
MFFLGPAGCEVCASPVHVSTLLPVPSGSQLYTTVWNTHLKAQLPDDVYPETHTAVHCVPGSDSRLSLLQLLVVLHCALLGSCGSALLEQPDTPNNVRVKRAAGSGPAGPTAGPAGPATCLTRPLDSPSGDAAGPTDLTAGPEDAPTGPAAAICAAA